MRYRNGARGFSSSPRSAGYGSVGMKKLLAQGDEALVVCQIESPMAVELSGQIAAVDGVHALFIGRADLALSMGFDETAAPDVDLAVDNVIAACKALQRSAVDTRRNRGIHLMCRFAPSPNPRPQASLGARAFAPATSRHVLKPAPVARRLPSSGGSGQPHRR